MHFLVTGGAGFIGSHLVESLLGDGHEVTVFDDFNDYYDPEVKHGNVAAFLSPVEVVEGDIRDAVLVERTFAGNKFDCVVHLAARAGVRPSISDPKLYFTTNIDGSFNLLDACRHHGVNHFVFASSSSVYGINKKVPFAESDPIERTISPYAATKLACEQICSNYSHLFGMRMVCLRFFTVFGPRQRPDLAISKFTHLLLEGNSIERYGDGSSARDYTYIDDIIQGVRASIDYDGSPFEIFNLGGSQTTTLSELIEIIQDELGVTAEVIVKPDQPGDVPRTFADVDKAKRLLGYEPKTGPRDGIRKYIKWVRETEKANG
ncbi:MAG: NAD-dependent epimerase/dehydratase family protein [Roseibacillus sp.]|jgi:UDP-glucuronate 4-epimerase